MSQFRLRYFEVFLALMQSGSTQGAAQRLNTTQPSISKSLGALERQLGFLLFVRTGSGLRPTAEAYSLMGEASRVNEEIESFQRVAGELREGRAVHLNIQVTSSLSTSVLPRAAALYKRRWRDAQLSIGVARTDAIVSSVRKHLIDIGLVTANDEQDIGPVRELWSAPMVCIFPRGHALSALSEVRPADLAAEPLVAYRSGLGQGKLVQKAFDRAGVEPRVEIRVNHSDVICAIVNEGYGVSVVDRLSVARAGYEGIEVRPFLPDCMVSVALVVSEQRPLSLQAERFRAVLQECLDDLAA